VRLDCERKSGPARSDYSAQTIQGSSYGRMASAFKGITRTVKPQEPLSWHSTSPW